MIRFYRQGLLVWLGIMVVCFGWGALDDLVLHPRIGPAAIPLTGVAMGATVFAFAWFALPRMGTAAARDYWFLGIFWLALSVAFECFDGRVVEKVSWADILAAYHPATLLTGNLWLFVVVAVVLAPRVVSAWQRPRPTTESDSETPLPTAPGKKPA